MRMNEWNEEEMNKKKKKWNFSSFGWVEDGWLALFSDCVSAKRERERENYEKSLHLLIPHPNPQPQGCQKGFTSFSWACQHPFSHASHPPAQKENSSSSLCLSAAAARLNFFVCALSRNSNEWKNNKTIKQKVDDEPEEMKKKEVMVVKLENFLQRDALEARAHLLVQIDDSLWMFILINYFWGLLDYFLYQ